MTEKSLDRKLAALHANYDCGEFILADAKDADMAFGIAGPGKSPEQHHSQARMRSLDEYRELIREIISQAVVDIVLMSARTNELLGIEERLFDNSPVTPAARANDATDIFTVRGGGYPAESSRPFRTATIDHIQCGKMECAPEERVLGANLGLYSVTFNNDLVRDLETLDAYKEFRLEAEARGFKHFLEVFDPNNPVNLDPRDIGGFINDHIVRSLGGVTQRGRPLFLKMVYHGPKFTEELASYSKDLIVGILGGGSGTTYDAFKLIAEAQKYGARVALFGRKINNAEHQLAFIRFLRLIVEGQVSPEEAVRAYHGVLQETGIRPIRSLEEDLTLQTPVMSDIGMSASASLSGSGTKSVVTGPYAAAPAPATPNSAVAPPPSAPAAPQPKPAASAEPDWDRMSPTEKIDWNQRRRDAIFGKYQPRRPGR